MDRRTSLTWRGKILPLGPEVNPLGIPPHNFRKCVQRSLEEEEEVDKEKRKEEVVGF